MTVNPVYGNVIDDRTVERALIGTLQAWIDEHLGVQEARYGKDQGSIARPRSWPAISEFDLKLHDQLPAVVVTYNGTIPGQTRRDAKGFYRQTFSYDVTVALVGADERDSRQLGSMYLAAVKSAIVQNRRLGGIAETTVLVGPDLPSVGRAIGVTTGAERAVYGTTFHVQVKDTLNDRLGPTAPPGTPYDPDPFPEAPDTVEIIVDADMEA
jgi:hypothetical protein